MRDATPSAIYLKDYRKPDYLIESVDLEFELQRDQTIVRSRIQARRRDGVAGFRANYDALYGYVFVFRGRALGAVRGHEV